MIVRTVRIPAAFYAHIPARVRCSIRREFYGLDDTRAWDLWHEEVQERYGVPRVVITRILTTNPPNLREAFFRWVISGR